MKILMYSARPYDKLSFGAELAKHPEIQMDFTESSLNELTVELAKNYGAVCVFVDDTLNKAVLEKLASFKINLVLCRCIGTDNVDWEAAAMLGINIKNVVYSPESVAEHALALLMTVNRHTHEAFNRVRSNNFSLSGLSGYCLNGKTVGIIGLGRIGQAFARICHGLGMKVIAYEPYAQVFKDEEGKEFTFVETQDAAFKVDLVDLDALYANSDVISLHLPLTRKTKHLINEDAIKKMKQDVILINVSRGALIDTDALVNNIKKFFGVGLDVYEGEESNAFKNHQDEILINNPINKLNYRNVVVTSHQAFLTDISLQQIAKMTIENALQ
jgi:D-lactate dehydrogenase